MKYNLLFLFSFFFLPFSFIQAQELELDTAMWVTDRAVNAVVRNGSTIYIGGGFTQVGPRTGNSVVLKTSDGKFANRRMMDVYGNVWASVSDGKGGWYIGGEFTAVQGVTRNRVAHILADGTLDKQWNPNANGAVYSLALSGNTLYLGGDFTSVDGQDRKNLAAIDATTGQATAWNPDANYFVTTLLIFENILYVGGDFSLVRGQARNGLAAIDATTGQVTTWNPNVNGGIQSLVHSQNTLYIGGYFSSVGGQARNRLAAIDVTTGQVTIWNPNANGAVHSLVLSVNNTLYVGGEFSTIGGQVRSKLAAIDITTGQATAWNPNVNDYVLSLALFGNTLYIGGNFTSVGGQARNRLAAIDTATGQVTTWNPKLVNGRVRCLLLSGNTLFAGGDFTSVGGQPRNGLASIDATTGQATTWNHNLYKEYGIVNSLALSGNILYVGGEFGSVDGEAKNLGAIDVTTGQATDWHPDVRLYIYSLALSGNTLYLGGDFISVDGQDRNKLAAIDIPTGQVTAWNPRLVNGNVRRLLLSGNTLFVSGSFTSIGGHTRNGLAAIDVKTHQTTAWNPDINGSNFSVLDLALSQSTLYIGGNFSSVGGQARKNVAAIDTTTGQVTAWNPDVNNRVRSLAISGNTLFVGGDFTLVDGQARNKLAAIDISTNVLIPWDHKLAGIGFISVETITAIDGSIIVSGSFNSLYNKPFPYFAAFRKKTLIQPNLISGTIYEDTNKNCVKDPGENAIANRVIVAEPGNYYAITDSSGNYSLAVDTGTYTVKQIIASDQIKYTQQTCPLSPSTHSVSFSSYNNIVSGKDFANVINRHYFLSAQVSSNRRRRCFTTTTTVSFYNSGNLQADRVKVHVKLPEYVVLVKASAAYTIDNDSNYVFTVGTLLASSSGSIQLTDSVVCNNPDIRGLTQCTTAWITPANSRTPSESWDQSDIHVKAKCRDNKVRLGIYNTGGGSMADSSSYRIYLDAQLSFSNNFKLAKGDSLILQVPAKGQTVRLEADQQPEHPSRKQSFITVEACGKDSNGMVSKGYVNQQVQEEEEPEISTQCLPIIDSYDPNDKLVLPTGVTENHYTPTNRALDYTIRFQNTGSDYAYKVVVVDTLSAHLDMSTLQVGTVSHPYKLSVSGKGKPVLTFTFNNINLPDSTKDQVASNGYIKFSIKPKEGLPEKTVIGNHAHIFFDYNEPVQTNITVNTIYDVPLVVEDALRLDKAIICTPTNTSIAAGINQVVCEQDTILLQALTPIQGKGTWKLVSGQGVIQDKQAAYSLVKELGYGENVFEWKVSANTCTDSLKAQVTITRLYKPTTPIITQAGNDSLVCSVIAAAYEWNLNGTKLEQTSQRIFVNQAGTYTVRVKDNMGCISEESAAFSFVLTAIDTYLYSLVSIYPNPSGGKFTISIPASLGPDIELSLVDAIGRTIYTSPVTIKGNGDYQQRIDLSTKEPGMYVCKLRTLKGVVVKKLFKQ